MRKLKKYKPTKFMAEDSVYSQELADYAVSFIECLCHTKGTWAGKPFELIDWQEQIIRDVFGTIKPNGYRQFNTAYIEIPDVYKRQVTGRSYPSGFCRAWIESPEWRFYHGVVRAYMEFRTVSADLSLIHIW